MKAKFMLVTSCANCPNRMVYRDEMTGIMWNECLLSKEKLDRATLGGNAPAILPSCPLPDLPFDIQTPDGKAPSHVLLPNHVPPMPPSMDELFGFSRKSNHYWITKDPDSPE